MRDIDRSIIATIVWFDIFDFPLTQLELDSFCLSLKGRGPADVPAEALAKAGGGGEGVSFASSQGFYFLKGREHIITTRLYRAAIAHEKFKKARRAAWWFARIPFVRMIAVGNTLGWNNARAESDIDFFIVAQSGHIFFVRFFTTLVAKVFGWRPTPKDKQDKICLSFFVADNVLNLESLQEPTLTAQWPYDIYLRFWVNQLTVLYDYGRYYQTFVKENAWCRSLLPYGRPRVTVQRFTIVLHIIASSIKRMGEWLLWWPMLERWLTLYQRAHLPVYLKEKIGRGTGVVVSNSILKFHDADKRRVFYQQFLEKYQYFNTTQY